MAYTKNTTWVEGGAPGITAAALNNLETQYDAAKADIDAKMHETTGHKHTGAAGDGPVIASATIINLWIPDVYFYSPANAQGQTTGNTQVYTKDSYNSQAITDTLYKKFLWQSAIAASKSVYFEVLMSVDAGDTAYAALKKVSDSSLVGQISTTSTTPVRIRSSAITLVDGQEYAISSWHNNIGNYEIGRIYAARLIIV